MAAGAVGGYFGARMAAAEHEVHFIARGGLLEAIRKNGLKIESPLGDLHLQQVNATDDPKKVGAVDIVLFAVKLWDTEKAGEQARPLVGPNTRVITLQNGVDSVERLAPILGADNVVGGTAYIATVMASPGVVSHTSAFAIMHCGRTDGRPDPQLQRFAEAAKAAGIDVKALDDMQRERWQKFIFLTALAGSTASTRLPLGPVMEHSETKAFFRQLMEEVMAVGRAKGVTLDPAYIDERMAFAAQAPKSMKASMLHDLERGNRLELDWLAGKVVTLGRDLGVPTPANEAVYAILKPYRMGRA